MSEEPAWNESSRDSLRNVLGSEILGELRLAKRSREEILDACLEIHIAEECPEDEWDDFVQFSADEFERASSRLSAEKAMWPETTDCDRLDRVEAALREQGILMWQASPCCDSCTCSELEWRINEISNRYSGFRQRARGYTFFIDQNMSEMLAESAAISIYLGYGWLSQDGSEVAEEEYENKALGIAREVCNCLRHEGFEPDWNGDFARKIGVSVNWQRRTMLT